MYTHTEQNSYTHTNGQTHTHTHTDMDTQIYRDTQTQTHTHTYCTERDVPIYVLEEALLAPAVHQLRDHELDRETPEIRRSPLLHVSPF